MYHLILLINLIYIVQIQPYSFLTNCKNKNEHRVMFYQV
jgi:hypothetical protein